MKFNGWTSARLGEISSHISSGSTPRGGQSVYLDSGPVMLIRSQNVRMNHLAVHDVAFISDRIDSEMSRSVVQFNDVLLNITGASIGRVARFNLPDARANVNQHVCIIRPRPDRLDSRFLTYFLGCPEIQSDINDKHQHGGTRQALTFSQIADFTIPLPSLAEQRRIAAILDKADAIRRKRRKAIELTEQFLKSAFLDMFGDPVTNPKEWPFKSIGEVGVVTTGSTPSTKKPEYFDGGIPWVRPTELGSWIPVNSTARTLSLEGLKVARTIRAGGTLVCCIGATLGKVGIAETDVSFNQQINAVDFDSSIDDWYGMFCLRLLAGKLIAAATHTTLPILNKGEFSRQQMPVPPIDSQEKFGRLVMRVLGMKPKATNSSTLINDLFDALVHRAFRGELSLAEAPA